MKFAVLYHRTIVSNCSRNSESSCSSNWCATASTDCLQLRLKQVSVSLVFLVTQASVLIYKIICTYSLNYYFDIEVATIITKLLYCMQTNILNFYKIDISVGNREESHFA